MDYNRNQHLKGKLEHNAPRQWTSPNSTQAFPLLAHIYLENQFGFQCYKCIPPAPIIRLKLKYTYKTKSVT